MVHSDNNESRASVDMPVPSEDHTSASSEGKIVVGCLYSGQYKSIFGAPDKVRCITCDKTRPLSQV
jgi:hypothetical protein